MPAALIKLILLTALLAISGCSKLQDELEVFKDDVDFDANNRTMDVERTRVEPIALEAIQSSLLVHLYLPIFDFLDASDLPSGAMLMGDEYLLDCDLGGTATYQASREFGEAHRKGDRFTVSYDNCQNNDEIIYNGQVRWTYSKLTGLNRRFDFIDTQMCVDQLNARVDGSYTRIENIDEDGEYYPVDTARFIRVKDYLEVDFLRLDGEDSNDNYSVVYTQKISSKSVIVLHNLEIDEDRVDEGVTRYKLASEGVTSIDGDQIFTASGMTFNREACQTYVRHADVSIANLSATYLDGTVYSMDGRVEGFESTTDFTSVEETIKPSDFSVSVSQGTVTHNYRFKDFEASKRVGPSRGAYSFNMSGAADFGTYGVAQLSSDDTIYAHGFDSAPFAGSIIVQGRFDEGVFVGFFPGEIRIGADFDGDNTGNGEPDNDIGIVTFWQDLLAMNFQEVP